MSKKGRQEDQSKITSALRGYDADLNQVWEVDRGRNGQIGTHFSIERRKFFS